VEGGAHRRASAGGDGGRDGAALSCARVNAREDGVRGARKGVGAPRLGPPGYQLLRMQHRQGARAARVHRRSVAAVARPPGPP
jgi:hypothetical protein